MDTLKSYIEILFLLYTIFSKYVHIIGIVYNTISNFTIIYMTQTAFNINFHVTDNVVPSQHEHLEIRRSDKHQVGKR